MSNRADWLEQTWEIKAKLAEKYADVSPSDHLEAMRESVVREWKKRGWTLVQKPAAPTGRS